MECCHSGKGFGLQRQDRSSSLLVRTLVGCFPNVGSSPGPGESPIDEHGGRYGKRRGEEAESFPELLRTLGGIQDVLIIFVK